MPPAGTTVPPSPRRTRRRRWPYVVAALVLGVALAALIASRISVNWYALTPGNATPVSQFIEVPPSDNHPLTGKILLTDVFVTQLNALNYFLYQHVDWLYNQFEPNSAVIPSSELLGTTPNESQFLDQGYLQMTQAQSYATAAALSHLGYSITSTNAGALVYGIAPNSPAATVLKVAQVITAVNSTPTPTECALITSLHGVAPGTTVSLTVEESSINDVGAFVGGPTMQRSVTLAQPPKGLVDVGCGPPVKPTAFLGIDPMTQQDWQFPVKVTVHTENIGGPSAGLAMTLGIIDKLSSGRLTGRHVVAATGTMDPAGNIGDVGGVAQKTVAVEHAGATVFFVPPSELKAAESKATPQLHVYPVHNLDQVLRILKRLGGQVPANPASAQAAP